jgi:2-hydroxychromene-2-carboxylate isomerase
VHVQGDYRYALLQPEKDHHPMPKTVELFYDFSSANSYFAALQLPAIAARHGATLLYRPFFLGGLFKTLGVHTAPGISSPGKAAHSRLDCERWSKRHQIPFVFPSRFPMNTVRALRTALVLDGQGLDVERYTETVMRAYWVDDRDIADPIVIGELLTGLGLDAAATLKESEQPAAKDALKQRTDEAVERGIFGAPTMVVDGELYFGKDRLDFVEDALKS